MIRIAAVGDVHYDKGSGGRLNKYLTGIHESADLLLLAGDLTQLGTIEEISVLADDLKECDIPIIAVLGNHDFHSDLGDKVCEVLTQANVIVLEGTAATFNIGNDTVGIAGSKGFGGGFVGACASDFGEKEMKAFIRFTKQRAEALKNALAGLDTDYKISLTHYSPVAETLLGEKKEIYPFLGSYLLAEAIDSGGADIAFHGHAHHGVEKGLTPGGIPVRNVAFPVIRHAFNIYNLNKDGLSQTIAPYAYTGSAAVSGVSAR
jgi:Icc-related predicted phosphoesterase